MSHVEHVILGCINIGSDRKVTLHDILRQIAQTYGKVCIGIKMPVCSMQYAVAVYYRQSQIFIFSLQFTVYIEVGIPYHYFYIILKVISRGTGKACKSGLINIHGISVLRRKQEGT